MKMIHYLIRYADCFEFYEKTIPKLVFEQASLEIFRYYLKNKRFGDAFIKYVGHQKTKELIENQITFITSFREFKVNDFLIWLDYIVKLDGISILSKSKFFKENLFNDLSVIIHPPLGWECSVPGLFSACCRRPPQPPHRWSAWKRSPPLFLPAPQSWPGRPSDQTGSKRR